MTADDDGERDARCVARAQGGDPSAFDELVVRHAPRVAAVARRLGLSEPERQAPAFAGGELRDRSRRRIEQHAAACPMCAELIGSLRRTVSALRALGTAPATPLPSPGSEADVISGVLARLQAERAADAGREPPDSS